MKKYAILSILFLLLATSVIAKNQNSENVSPSGNQVQNQNQIQTQNQGEESQIQQSTQEEEVNEVSGKPEKTRNPNALEHMSQVAIQVHELQQIGTTGGLGEQVRQIAREQNQAQTQIQQDFDKVNNRNKFVKFLIGSDFKALKNMQQQLEQNQLRIQQLQQLQTQLTNQADIDMVQATIQLLMEQNTSLQENIDLETQSGSLFGWLFKLFADK